MALVALLWSPILRNDVTPAGDGARIMKFVSFARAVGGFAFWNPYRNGGYPLAADPEHFWILSLVIDPASPYANVALNAVLFALILLLAVLSWLIGRRLGLRPFWNVLFVTVLSFNERVIWVQLSGRSVVFVYQASLLVVMWALLQRPLHRWNYVVISVAIGIAFAGTAHFAIVHCALVTSALLFSEGPPWQQPLMRSLSALARAALVCIGGVALSGIWTIPLLAHFAESYRITSAVAYLPQAPESLFAYARLFVPFVPADLEHVSFLCLLVVPAVLLARWGRIAKAAPGGLGFDLIYIWGGLFVLMSVPWIGPAVKTFYQMIPFASGVRWFSPFEVVVRTVLIVNAFAIFQTLEQRRVDELDGMTRLGMGAYLALVGAFAAAYGFSARETVTAWAGVACATLAAYSILSGAGVRVALLERATVAGLGGVLVVLSSAMIASELSWQYYPGTDAPTHTTNQRDSGLETIVRSDPDPYFRFIFGDFSSLYFLDDEKRGTAAFSLFYPPSLARTLTYLSSRHQTAQLRPHWVRLVECTDFDPRALDLIGVKYMFCRPDSTEPRLSANWQEVGREHGTILFRNAAYQGGIRIFCRWRSGAPPWERDDVLSAFSQGVALLEPAAVQALPTPDAGCTARGSRGEVDVIQDRPGHMTLRVTSATPGIVLIPDNYDRGWHAAVNGVATPVMEVYGAYLGIPIAAGQSVVTIEYQDRYFWIGAAVTLLAVIGLSGYAALAGWGRK
jgi:Bacterial membrane protein YfhO